MEKNQYYVGLPKIKIPNGAVCHRAIYLMTPSRAMAESQNPESSILELKGPFKTYDGAKWASEGHPIRYYGNSIQEAEQCAREEIEKEAINIRKEGEEDTARPGKFQGEARYVPYFWDQAMQGFSDDDGNIISVEIESRDKIIWPELRGRKRVKLWECDQGFVREYHKPKGRLYRFGGETFRA